MAGKSSSSSRRGFVKMGALGIAGAAAAGLSGWSVTRPALAGHTKDKARALHFDVGGTILDWNVIPDKLTKFFAERGLSVDVKAFWNLWLARFLGYAMMNTLIGGAMVPFHELGRRAVITAGRFQKVEIKPADAAAIADMWTDLPFYPDVLPGLNHMRRLGYLLVPVTQWSSDMVRKGLIERHPFKWDAWFTSDMWGVFKPHRSIYHRSIDAMNLHPSEVIFVTTNQFDMFGAKGVGLRVAWVNRANQPLEAYGETPDWTVKDFVGLAKVLEAEKP